MEAVTYHTGETMGVFQRRTRRQEIAAVWQAVVDTHLTGTMSVAWENADTHEDDEVEAAVRAAAGRLVLQDLPTCSLWVNPIDLLWRHCRRNVTHGEVFETKQALLAAAKAFCDRSNRCPEMLLSVMGSKAKKVV
jgi:putative transposase